MKFSELKKHDLIEYSYLHGDDEVRIERDALRGVISNNTLVMGICLVLI